MTGRRDICKLKMGKSRAVQNSESYVRKLRSALLSFHFRNTLTSTRKILTACSTISLRGGGLGPL